MELLHVQKSMEQLKEKGILTESQTNSILKKTRTRESTRLREPYLKEASGEVALLCEAILTLNQKMEEETIRTRAIKNAYYQKTIKKFKLALFLNALVGFLDRKIQSMQAEGPSRHTGPFGLSFYQDKRAQLLAVCQEAFPRFQFK
jgi:hypothetical protein